MPLLFIVIDTYLLPLLFIVIDTYLLAFKSHFLFTWGLLGLDNSLDCQVRETI